MFAEWELKTRNSIQKYLQGTCQEIKVQAAHMWSRQQSVSRLEKPDDLPECPSPTVRLPNEQESQPTISLMLFFFFTSLDTDTTGRPAEIKMFWDKRMNQEVLVFGAIQSPYFTHLTPKIWDPNA